MTQVSPRPAAKRNRLLTAAASVVCHAAVLLALVGAQPDQPPVAEPPVVQMQLVALPPEPPAPPAPEPTPEPPAPTPPKPKPAKRTPTPPRKVVARPAPAPPTVRPLLAQTGPVANPDAEVSDAELASAASAGSASGGGGGGGSCDMLQWLQGKLRKDRRVQSAIADAHRGRAIRVWNGDWVRHPGQDGNGLAAVREAIMWEVAFAPEACRTQRVHGLVQLSLNDGPGAARVVMGSGDWRWSDVVSRSRR